MVGASVDHEVADMLAEDQQLEFARGVLQVSSTCQDRVNVVWLFVDTFMTAWRFTKLSDSRWVTLGPASQAVVMAAFCGLENLVSFIRSKVGAFLHHLGGFARYLGKTKEFMVQAAIVCRVSDRVLQLLLKVPRVLLQYDETWKVASEELLWVASLEDSAVRSLARRGRVEADEFKPSVIAAAHVSYHFIRRRVLRTASEYPWSWARGD